MKLKIFLWALVYNAVCIAGMHSKYSYFIPVMVLIYTSLFVGWLYKTKQHISAGLTMKGIKKEKLWIIAPLFILPLYNLCISDHCAVKTETAVLMLGAVVTEEIFFRGIIPQLFSNKGLLKAVVLSNILFALYHLTNITADMSLEYVIVQMILSFAVGMCYSFTAVVHKSILPCTAAHFATNITCGKLYSIYDTEGLWLILIAAIYMIYNLYLFKSNRKIFT